MDNTLASEAGNSSSILDETTMTLKTFLPAILLLFASAALAQEADGPADPGPAYDAPSEGSSSSRSGSSDKMPLRFFFAGGPMLLTGLERNFGAHLMGGAEVPIDRAHLISLGIFVSKTISGERVNGRFAGGVHRMYFFPYANFYAIPDRLYGRVGLGLGHLSGSHSEMSAKLKPSYALGLGYRHPIGSGFDLGGEVLFEHSGQASKSMAFIVDDLSCALGDCDATGTIPRANIWSFNLTLGYSI